MDQHYENSRKKWLDGIYTLLPLEGGTTHVPWSRETKQQCCSFLLFFCDVPLCSLKKINLELSLDEWIRGACFRFSRDRYRFILVRSVLRRLLAQHLGIRPNRVRFSYNAWGKPVLFGAGDGESISFNVSHANQLACITLTSGQRIGVDVEYIRTVPEYEEIARSNFTAREYDAMMRCPHTERQAFFFLLWSQKEAFSKATGEGLSRPLASFELPLVDISSTFDFSDQNVQIRPCCLPEEMVMSFIPAPGYVGAIAVAAPISPPR